MKWILLLGVKALFGSLFVVIGAVQAELPAQTRPASIEPFLGKWEGSWRHKGGAGGVSADLSKLAADTVRFQASITGPRAPEAYEAPARYSNGELNVDLPTLTMVFRLHGNDNLEVSYVHNEFPGTYSLTRRQAKAAEAPPAVPTSTADDLLKTLVARSLWSGEFGPRPVGTLTLRFADAGGALTGEVTAINAGTSTPGPLAEVRIAGERVSFKMPGNSVQVDLGLKGEKLEGTWFGRSSGWMVLTPAK